MNASRILAKNVSTPSEATGVGVHLAFMERTARKVLPNPNPLMDREGVKQT